MYLTKLTAENFKRIELVQIEFDASGGVTTISGPNGAGKTSTIDALASVIAGRNAPKIPNPIRKGEDRAVVIAETDAGLIITRRYRRKDDDTIETDVTITNAEGMTRKSPQQLLDTFLAGYTLDPLAFAAAKPADQVAQLLQLVDLPFDPDALDQEYSDTFETRTAATRMLRDLEGQLAGMPVYADAPAGEQSAAALVAELEAAQRDESVGARLEADVDTQEVVLADRRRHLAEYRDLVAKAEAAVEQDIADLNAARAARDAWQNAPRADLNAIRESIETVDDTNAKVRANAEHARVAAARKSKAERVTELTAALEGIKRRRADGLAAATFPLPGLGFGDGMVTLNGIPFSQASAAEQLVASVAIAGAANPALRLVLIRDASLLDSTNRALIERYAEDNDLRIILELVDEHAETGVVITDGTNA